MRWTRGQWQDAAIFVALSILSLIITGGMIFAGAMLAHLGWDKVR